MPVVRQNTTQGTGKVIMKYGTRRVLMHHPASFSAAVTAARKEFKLNIFDKIELRVNMAELDPNGAQDTVEISSGSWDLLLDCARTPTVEVHSCASAAAGGDSASASVKKAKQKSVASKKPLPKTPSKTLLKQGQPLVLDAPPKPAPPPPSSNPPQGSAGAKAVRKFGITVETHRGAYSFLIKHTTLVSSVMTHVAEQMHTCPKSLKMIWQGQLCPQSYTFADLAYDGYEVEDGDVFDVYVEQAGGKPVIYLMPPAEQTLSASVQLALVPEWSFSAIYPIAPVSTKGPASLECLTWDVDVRADGTLFDKRTAAEVTYLYWEATTNAVRPPSPPLEDAPEAFNPAYAVMTPSNSVLLDVSDVPSYIDKALYAMTLHTEARTSFITYWLPAILKHKYIALRFLPQTVYEPSAPMQVTPIPDVVTRVFMLFRGIEAKNVDNWRADSLEAGPEMWKDVVSVDESKARDTSLFRVLEWGGMEVKV